MDSSFINIAIVVVYLLAMLAFGWWGKSRTKNNSDFLVAGRRLGPMLYTGTMAAVVPGGASTVGGVGLGYKFGISGMWLVVAIGSGVLLLPFVLNAAGGLDGIRARVDASFFQLDGIGVQTIITYFVVYTLGLLIGQDIWQRVFTAKTPKVARWGGATAGIYCVLYGVAGALIGLAARVALPNIDVKALGKDVVYAEVATHILPIGIGGLVMAAAVAAMMSTASGALIAAATVARADVVPFVASWFGKTINTDDTENPEHDVKANRYWVLGLGIVAVLISMGAQDVVVALTIAYDILVGGLLVAILGGLVWKRGTGIAAAWSMAVGSVLTLALLIAYATGIIPSEDGVYANDPIYWGLGASLLVYVVVSLLTPPTEPEVREAWDRRVAGAVTEELPLEVHAVASH
ncbi:hypothetical protein OOZ51_13980 [Arthrobacter sp. MI7-26]|uniref:sodium:solute symporter family transporter n=1 Tax=Arthrobacter sp. MI7-26 TaxID=2993653 RepID=UPI002248AE19|nr:hypothetical protein [Arthrobacter sp. MI7-26]MCX2748912.1 hypothetical protein [Arthrobacter sp. MI7-26]